ncbi:mediator of DNA damage checkpoint protein 1-like [Lineus longissimus]|uniref:mediator of DNA damage checkpoint protein 1-like n=1 Tax=Lineus longissimus TaxID=88925 RepID=UPI002B4C3248
MDYECTQAIPLSDYEEETDDGRTDDKSPVGQLLVNCQKGFPETIFPLYEGDNVIGRQQDKVNIYIPLKAISKQHACIEIRDREVHFIYDMESRNKSRRGKMFLTPKVRYELKDGDTLLFGDVTTVYKKVVETKPDDAGSETGSETGSESMLINVSAVDSQNDSVGPPPNDQGTDTVRVEESFIDDDAASDASVDLLAATAAYGAGGSHVTVEETPIPSRTTKRINECDITIPESPLDADATKPTLRVSASGDDSYVFDAPTQAYRDPDGEDTIPDRIFDCPTQAYGNDEDDDATDDEAVIDLDGPTQAYPGGASPVFGGPTQAYGDQDGEGPTQAYALEKETIEPTLAYSMDGVKVTKDKSKPTKTTKQESEGFSLEKTEEGDSDFDPSILEGPTQAYPDPDAARPTQQMEEDSPAYGFLGSTFVSPQGGKVSATVSSSASTVSPSTQPTQLLRKDSEDQTQILPGTSAADVPTQILSSPKHTKCDIPDTLIISSPKHNKEKIPDTMVISSPEYTSESLLHAGKKGIWPPCAGSINESIDSEASTQILDASPSPPKRKAKKVSIFSDQPTQVYGEDSIEGESGGCGFDDEATQKYDDVEATQAYGDEGEAETRAYGDVEVAETQGYGDEAATQAYGDNAETQAYGDPGEEAETQAYGTDECRVPLEEMQTLAYDDGNEVETQGFGDNANEMETQAYGCKADEMETQAYGTKADEMETQAYDDDVDDGETQAYGLEVVPDSEEIDTDKTETKRYEEFPESMEDIFEDVRKRKSHVFRKPLDYSEDDDETQPMTEELDDELPDLDADAAVVEQELDVPPDVALENEASNIVDEHDIEEKNVREVKSFAEKSKEEIVVEVSEGSSRGKGCGKKTDRQKSPEKPKAAECKDTDVVVKDAVVVGKGTDGKAAASEKESGSRRGCRSRHGRNVSEDGPVLLDVREIGLRQKPVPEGETAPSRSEQGKAKDDIIDESKSKRGKSKKVEEDDESEAPQGTGRSRRGKMKGKPEESSTELISPVRKAIEEELVGETGPRAFKSKKVVDTGDSSELVVPKSTSRRGASQVKEEGLPDASTSGSVADEAGDGVAMPVVERSRGRQRTRKKKDDDSNSVVSENIDSESSGKIGSNRRGKEPSPAVTESKVTRGAMTRRSLPAEVVKPLGTPKRGRRSVAFTGLEDESELVTSEVSEKDIPSTKAGRKGRGKAASKLSPAKDDPEEDRESVASEVSEKDVPSAKAGRKGKGKAASKLSRETEELADAVSGDAEDTGQGKGKRSRRMSKKMTEAVDAAAETDKAETVGNAKGRKGKQTKNEEADVCESKQSKGEEPAEESVKSIRGKRSADISKKEDCDASATKRTKRGAKKQEEEEKEADDVEEESHAASASKRSKRGADKKEDVVEGENVEPEPETIKSKRGRRAGKKIEHPKEEVKEEPETISRGSRRQSDVKVPDDKRGKGKVTAEEDDISWSRSSSRGKKEEDVKPVLPAPRGRGRRSHQPAAEDDETDSMSTTSEVSEVTTASSARGRRGKTMAVEQSPATTPKGARGKRTASNESKEPTATPTRGNTPAATPTRGKGASAAVERLTSPRLQNLPGEQHHKILFTGVVDDKGQKVVKDLRGELVTGTDDCTHLVTDRVRRTVKFLCCLGRGVPIISTDWLDRCAAAKRFVDHTLFIVKDAENEKKFGFKLLTSLQKADAHKLFTDYKIHVTKNVKPDPSSMKQIIVSAEGKYLPTMPKKGDERTVIVSCDEDKRLCQAALNAGVHVVSNEFVLTGLLQQSIDIEKFSLFTSEQVSGSVARKRPAQGTPGDSAKKQRR